MSNVLIAVPTGEFSRQGIFYDYLNILDKPYGTMLSFARGQSPAAGRNLLIKGAIEKDCSHILFVDDDVLLPPNTLTKLLAHDKDMVTGLYLMRNYPHKPILFDWTDDKGRCRNYYPADSDTDLVEVVNCGLGCVLIKIEVFKAMKAPWITLGELDPENWCDDIAFFNRARAAGFKLHCDLSIRCGHIASVAVWPEHIEGKWFTKYDTFGAGHAMFPSIRPAHVNPNAA